jgi:hypothetical protein
MNNRPKIRKTGNLLLQSFIFAATYFFIYDQVFRRSDPTALADLMRQVRTDSYFTATMWLVMVLMMVNWSLEALKWRYLIRKIEKVSVIKSLQAVLTGVSISSFTPNRVGEYFGRVFILKTASRIEGILITVVGSVSQLLVTVITGSVALLMFLPRYLPGIYFHHTYIYYGIVAGFITLDLVLLILFFNLAFLTTLKERILRSWLKQVRRFFRVFAFYHNRELATALLFSMSRYAVFSTQFYLLLRLTGVPVPYPQALMLISMIYFIMAVIPTVALTELGIRGSVSVYFFGVWLASNSYPPGDYHAAVFAASTLLWMINLGIPALTGTLFLFRLQFFRKSPGSL